VTATAILDDAVQHAWPSRWVTDTGARLYQWQQQSIDDAGQQIIVACSRRVGKTWAVSAKGGHHAATTPDGLTLAIAPVERQAKALFANIVRWLKVKSVPMKRTLALEAELRNGHKIVALPGSSKTIRGTEKDPTMILLDEAAFASDELYYEAIDPMMSAGQTTMILLSTPFGKRGFFYDIWASKDPDWNRYRITAYESERIDPKWLEKKRRNVPARVFRQEYLAEFTEMDDAVFTTAQIEYAMKQERPFFTNAGVIDVTGDPANVPFFMERRR